MYSIIYVYIQFSLGASPRKKQAKLKKKQERKKKAGRCAAAVTLNGENYTHQSIFFVCVSYERLPIHFLGGVLVYDSWAVKCLTESAYGLSFKTDEELVFFSFPLLPFVRSRRWCLERKSNKKKEKKKKLLKGGIDTRTYTHHKWTPNNRQ